MNNNGKILTALAAGVAVGAVMGILFAPDKGYETRKKISDGGQKLADNVKDTYKKGKERINGLAEDIKDSFSQKREELV